MKFFSVTATVITCWGLKNCFIELNTMRIKRAIYKYVRNKFCLREILRLVILSTAEYCCKLKMLVVRGMHKTGFQFGTPRLVQEGMCDVSRSCWRKDVSFVRVRAGPRDPGCLVWFCLRSFKILGGLFTVLSYLRKTTNIGLISCLDHLVLSGSNCYDCVKACTRRLGNNWETKGLEPWTYGRRKF